MSHTRNLALHSCNAIAWRSMIKAETGAAAEMLRCKRCGVAPIKRAVSARSVWLVDVQVFSEAGCNCSSHNMGVRVSFMPTRASSSVLAAQCGRGERRRAVRTGFARLFFVGFFHDTRAARGIGSERASRQNPQRCRLIFGSCSRIGRVHSTKTGTTGRPMGASPLGRQVTRSCTGISRTFGLFRLTKPRAT